jgi:type VI secretion system protein ImpL
MLVSLKRAESRGRVIDLPPSAMKDSTFTDKLPFLKKKKKFYIKREEPLYIGEWLNQFLIARGYVSVNDIVKSFFKAMQFLKEALGINYKYKLPWYMTIGIEESGKSSLLSGFTHDEISEENASCTWWFLKDGVILDIKGNIFLPREGFNADEKNWQLILNLLLRYRAHKPLNGIILTIPASEFYGKGKRSPEEIKQRAQYIARKLNFTQNYIGMKLPIYIVITKTDVVPGFQSFCSEIPMRNRNNMLGWSCPYPLDTLYSPRWIDECFDSLEDELNEIRMEIFAESSITTTKDGVFVFPSELLSIKENVGLYLDALFKNSSLEERFYFRGLYFTGDSKMVPLLQFDQSQSEGDMAILGTPDADVNEAGQVSASMISEQYAAKKIFFFEDLLLKKIFMEDGMAAPMRAKLQQSHKSVFVIKISTALFVVVGSFGLFNAKDKLKSSQDNLFPVLYKISSLIKDVQYLTLDNLEKNGNEVLGASVKALLMMMHQLNDVRFLSVFVPASWFSNINKSLTDTMRAAYQRVIVRTIYMNLILKARTLLSTRPDLSGSSQSISSLLNPHSSTEYKLLKGYVSGLLELEKNIKKFDSLRTSGDPKDLNDLIEYTFQGSLPEEFLENYQQYRSILMNTPFAPIDLSPYQKMAIDVLMNLFQSFLDAVFTDRSKNSIIALLNNFINQITKQNLGRIPDIKNLIAFSNDLTNVCSELGEDGKTWLDNDVFEAEPECNEFLDKVEALFGKQVSQQLLDIMTINFGYLKSRLVEFNKLLDADISAKVKKVDDSMNNIPSKGIFRLQRCLSAICKEPYMVIPEQYSLITDLPEGKMVFWDDELIQYAFEIGKRFEQFFSTAIKEFPRVLQEGVTLLAKTNLAAVISGIVGKAQSFVAAPTGITDEITSEEILQRQVIELKGVAPKFVSLLRIFKHDSLGIIFGNLRAILNKVGFTLLDHIDRLLEKKKPYCPSNLSFNFWDGKVGAGYSAYSSADIEELNMYLQIQRKTIERLALDFADVIVTFLNSDSIFDADFGNQHQLTKWARIVDSAKSFAKKDPANSVSMVENFIKKTLNSYTLDNITMLINLNDIRLTAGDYFLSIIRTIKRAIMSRAEVLIRQRNINRYQTLRDYYNKHLEKTYPFCDYDRTKRVSIDADIMQVKEFFSMYDEFGGSPKSILDQIYQLEEAKEAYNFLKKLHDIRMFFGDFFDNRYESLKARVEVDFSSNKREEKNTDYLIDRVFKPSNEASIESVTSEKSAVWYLGEPVELSLRWAEMPDITQRPVSKPNDPDLTIDENKATIQCRGNWALLRFLQKYKSKTADVDAALPNQVILSFEIPLNDGKVAVVFLGCTVSRPQRPGDATIMTVKVPWPPGKMPALPNYVLLIKDQSVLVDLSATEFITETSAIIPTLEEEETENEEIEPSPIEIPVKRRPPEEKEPEKKRSDNRGDDKRAKKKKTTPIKKKQTAKKEKKPRRRAESATTQSATTQTVTPAATQATMTSIAPSLSPAEQKKADEEKEALEILKSRQGNDLDESEKVIQVSEEPIG